MTIVELERCIRSAPSYPIEKLQQVCMSSVKVDGLCLEFGVYVGGSLRSLADKIDRPFYGFDSFEGLPEDWRPGCRKGTFAVKTLPTFHNPRIQLVKGWFDETIPSFLHEHPDPIAFIHIDCDLYSSTKTIFQLMSNRFVPGTVILFDEIIGYPEYADHEIKAFSEFLSTTSFTPQCLGNTLNNGNAEQAAFILQ